MSSAVAGPSKKPKKRRVEGGGRVTPKGGPKPRAKLDADSAADTASTTPSASSASKSSKTSTPASSTRYTPPADRTYEMPSPMWVPVLMFSLFGLGMLTIFLNYVSLLPGAVSNWYLLLGLGFILGGIVTATQYR